MLSEAATEACARALGHDFAHPAWLDEALTHATWANEHGRRGHDYQRLEFLGDAVLGLMVSHALFVAHPSEREGSLSRRRACAVREASLAAVARKLGLAAYVRAGQGQRDEGFNDSILADVVEALMGAVFLDAGLGTCERIFLPLLQDAMRGPASPGAGRDAKTQLQELCHRRRLPPPHYATVAEEGPSHGRTFCVQLTVGTLPPQQAQGRSKKRAEQACAERLLAQLLGGQD